jgi:hypothetical protein
VLLLRVGDAAQGTAEINPDPFRRRRSTLARAHGPIRERQLAGYEPELAEPIELTRRFRRHPGEGVEVVDLGGDLRSER